MPYLQCRSRYVCLISFRLPYKYHWIVVPVWLCCMHSWPGTSGTANWTLWGLWWGGIHPNNLLLPQMGRFHHENGAPLFLLLCEHLLIINLVVHLPCYGAKWARLSWVQGHHQYLFPPWATHFCWWKPLQLPHDEEAICMVIVRQACYLLWVSVSWCKIFHLVISRPGLWAGSQPKPAVGSRAGPEPKRRLTAA